jgi:ApaG protein
MTRDDHDGCPLRTICTMATPEMSDQVTQGIRVGAAAFYLPQESDPDDDQFAFGYTIVISNEGDRPAQLLKRHWIIIDADGRREDVRGPGVVGETPRLEPGQAFKYQSLCPLRTPWGTMEGTYTMQRDDGELFEARIGRFYLRMPAHERVAGAPSV